MILDDFAGPGGWDEGLRMIGRTDTIGIEWDEKACETAVAAGHKRIRADVSLYPSEPFAGKLDAYIASPPCQAWSMAGKRKGELDRANCHVLADRMAKGDDSLDWADWEDFRSPLVCQPIRRIRDLRPALVALEEVPAVLGLWEHFARILRGWGYSVWTGVLCAADYGVPQTRRRCILMASRDGIVAPPAPSHAEHPADDLFGSTTLGWISMAEALGWGFDNAPSATVSGGGTESGGAEPFANAAYRRRLAWWVQRERSGERSIEGFDATAAPAQCLTSKTRSWTAWPYERPATTVVGSFSPETISPPGYRTDVSRQNAEGGVKVTVAEGGVLQSFPADYPWQGSRTKQYEQVGNAVPPLLAAHIGQALGLGTLAQENAA